jgi:hypothetical protein
MVPMLRLVVEMDVGRNGKRFIPNVNAARQEIAVTVAFTFFLYSRRVPQ